MIVDITYHIKIYYRYDTIYGLIWRYMTNTKALYDGDI